MYCYVFSWQLKNPATRYQAFQSMMGSHKFSPDNGRCFDWRLSSLTVGMPFLLLTHSTINAPMLIQAEAMFGATQRQI